MLEIEIDRLDARDRPGDAAAFIAQQPWGVYMLLNGRALASAARIAHRRLGRLLPRGPTGNLRASLQRVRLVDSRIGGVRFRRSAAWLAYGGKRHKAPHAHLLEYGTDERYTSSGKSVGAIRGYRFLERAVRETRAQQVAAFDRSLKRQHARLVRQIRSGNVPPQIKRLAGIR